MNARLPLLSAAALSIFSLVPASAADMTWTYTPNKDLTGVQTIDGITISPTYTWVDDSLTSFINSDSSLQIGSSGHAVSHVRYDISTSLSGKPVSKVVLTAKVASALNNAASANKARFSASVGNTTLTYSGDNALTSSHADYEFSIVPSTSGDVVIEIDSPLAKNNSTSYAIYIRSIEITLKEDSGLTPLDAPTGLAASNNDYTSFSLSWIAVSGATGYTVTVKNANNEVVGTPVVNGTGATVTGLASGGTYTAYVTALGDGTTHDDSEPASLSNIQTTAPTVLNTPTGLASSNVGYFGFALSWTAVSDANGYTVTLSPAAGSVEVSGTTATVTGLAEGETYTASVVAKGNGTTTIDSTAATLDVTTATAPAVSAPVLTATDVSSSAFTVSWPAQNDASFSVRAWTLVPADVATEDFSGYPDEPPTDWLFNTNLDAYNSDEAIVKLDASGESVVSPTYPAVVSSLSFKLQGHGAEGSSVSVSGSSDGTTWNELTNIVLTSSTKVNEFVLPDIANRGMKVFKWEYTRSKGGVGFGSVSVSGTGVGKSRFYLDGYGSDAAGVPVAGTSVTISNPVAGETNYIEVTATGLSGKTASATIEVDVPSAAESASVVISVR